MHVALGGCLKGPPVSFGITADTGGHISYVLEAAAHQAALPGVDQVTVVTRLFEAPHLGDAYARAHENVAPGLDIRRIATTSPDYLEKEALADEMPAFADAFCEYLAGLPRRPDVIHAHFADAAAIAAVVQRRYGIPFVFTPHALGIDKRGQGMTCAGLDARIEGEHAAIAGAAAIVVSTRDEAERQLGGYAVPLGRRVHVVPPGVPRRDLIPTGPTLADRLSTWLDHPERPVILAVARPVAKKNLAALVRAYAAHDGLRDAANLVILAGQHAFAGAEEAAVLAELIALAATPALKGRVALPPRHDALDVAALYARASAGGVFVNPALHEPFGLTLIEAAAAGVPVVATRHGGASDIVETIGHGLLVDPRDERAIAEAAFSIVSDPARQERLGRAGRLGARGYCWHRYAAASVALYAAAATPRFLVSDIDNTLTGCREGAAAFADWRRQSTLPFIVATGRGIEAARLILRRWHLPMPDAFITDVGTTLTLPDGAGGWREDQDYARALDRGWDRAGVAAVLATLDLAPQPAATARRHKISFFGDAGAADRIRRALAAAGLPARVVFSHGRLIDVLAPGGGKAAAIAAFAARHGWTLADAVASGDSGNDEDMLAACGHAILVGNASDELAHLAPRPGLYRARRHHAAGVVDGLAMLGLAATDAADTRGVAIAA
ncbi:HAD family hydrolase [Sphingomonas adhaesiva]|uniref:HAD family hydrolase n=1 Tax=Sphingomonas adhaesiva TaxID=28212 RepID=UPI002FF491BB